MSYSLEDLSLFDPLADSGKLDGTSYFEFHPNELPGPNQCWLPRSLFIRDAAFDFFAECFHTASATFDYFSFQRFGEVEIVSVVGELELYLSKIENHPTREQLFARYASLFTTSIWNDVDTEALVAAVHECGLKLRSFIQSETRESKCLWVLGM